MGTLKPEPARSRPDLLADPVLAFLDTWSADAPDLVDDVLVAPIDPALADTAAFCEAYDVGLDASANCVVVAGKRQGEVRYAACLVLATTRADVNGVVRRLLDVRKASFAPMDEAVAQTGMEYGGITPIGLPEGWPVLIDSRVAGHAQRDHRVRGPAQQDRATGRGAGHVAGCPGGGRPGEGGGRSGRLRTAPRSPCTSGRRRYRCT